MFRIKKTKAVGSTLTERKIKMAAKKKNKWVDFKKIKSNVSMRDILDRYGLLEGLKQKGDELIGLCPFHKETEGSFRANLKKNAFHCFGCKAKGNVLDFVRLKEGDSIREAGLLIQDWFEIPSESSQKASTKGEKPKSVSNHSNREKEDNSAVLEAEKGQDNPPLTFSLKNLDYKHPYLSERGLNQETIQYFGLGYCSRGLLKGRIAIPIHNENGELVAYAGRWPGKDPPEGKYKLPPGFQKSLVVFNLNHCKELSKEKGLILVKGFFDCFKVWQVGFKNAVALMGSSMSPEQEELIVEAVGKNGRAILMFDGDKAGQECTDQAMARLGSRVFVKATKLDEGLQPDKLSKDAIKKLLG